MLMNPFWNEDVEVLFLSIVHGNYSFHTPYWSKVSDDVKDLIRGMVRIWPRPFFTPDRSISSKTACSP